jgi:hypothetical protein
MIPLNICLLYASLLLYNKYYEAEQICYVDHNPPITALFYACVKTGYIIVLPRSLVQGRIHKLKNFVNSRPKSVFKDQEAVKCLSPLHATTRVNSFTIFLLSLFYCRQNLCQVNRQFFRRTS